MVIVCVAGWLDKIYTNQKDTKGSIISDCDRKIQKYGTCLEVLLFTVNPVRALSVMTNNASHSLITATGAANRINILFHAFLHQAKVNAKAALLQFLHLSVCLSVILFTGGGCLPQCMLGYHTHPPGADTPQEQTPPPGRQPPPPCC